MNAPRADFRVRRSSDGGRDTLLLMTRPWTRSLLAAASISAALAVLAKIKLEMASGKNDGPAVNLKGE